VLAQMNSQLIFRLANVEDLGYVRESFEAAGTAFLADLPTLDTGICLCAGTMIAMPVRCDVPLFAPRRTFPLAAATLPHDRDALKEAVVTAMPEAALVSDAEELVVFAGPEAEVTIRSQDGGYTLDVDCDDAEIAERVRQALDIALTDDSTR
jgi:DNA helicase HerA-like ATPase